MLPLIVIWIRIPIIKLKIGIRLFRKETFPPLSTTTLKKSNLTLLNPLSVRLLVCLSVLPFVRSFVRQSHLWAVRALQSSAGARKKPPIGG